MEEGVDMFDEFEEELDLFDLVDQQLSEGLIKREVKEMKQDLNADNVADILGLAKQPQKEVLHTNVIDRSQIDEFIYEDMASTVVTMKNGIKDGKRELQSYEALHQDLFQSLYKMRPELHSLDQVAQPYHVNHRIMSELNDLEEFKRLRRSCAADDFNAALGVNVLDKEVRALLKTWKEENGEMQQAINDANQALEAQNQANQAAADAQTIQQLMNSMQQQGMPIPSSLQENLAQAQLNAQQAKEYAQQMQQKAQESSQNIGDQPFEQLRRAAKQACNMATGQIKEDQELINSWGFEPGEGIRVPIENKRQAIEELRNNSKLKKITKLLGNLKTIVREEQRRKTKENGFSIKSIEIGNKIESVLPSEKMKLIHPTLKKDFYRRFNQKELLQYEKEATRNKAKGPIVCCVDTSGSMSGNEEVWSKAVAVAMLEMAQKQKRDFCVILYAHKVDRVFFFERERFNPMDVVEMAERFSSGGTDFEAPLQQALDIIQTSKYKKADIVFITDGDCGMSDEFLRKFNRIKEDKEFFCQGILIGSGRTGTLKEFCDDITIIDNIRDMATVADTAENRKIFSTLA